ncbi:MAG: TetR/AcrR family transcriptional regulator [Alcanivorax sp.]|nr:TetR/AcrR family transcriptional regulator [Alcanivorax sp.]
MAKNKRNVDAKLKKAALEETAARLFMAQGFDATSMQQIARELDVAPNTLYWYYPSKDELLVGVLDRLLSQTLQRLPAMGGLPLKAQMAWILDELEQSREMVATVHGRLDQSPVIRAWHDQFHQFVEGAVICALNSAGVEASRSATLATVATFLVEGLLAHPHSAHQRNDILEWFAASAGGQ